MTDDLIERADLGSELVRAVSRYEDTFERALLPLLSDPNLFGDLDEDRAALRDTMDEIHQRTMGIDPRNVHASDGQGFEDALTSVVAKTRALLMAEDREVAAVWDSLGEDERRTVTDEVTHASETRPNAPTRLGRP